MSGDWVEASLRAAGSVAIARTRSNLVAWTRAERARGAGGHPLPHPLPVSLARALAHVEAHGALPELLRGIGGPS